MSIFPSYPTASGDEAKSQMVCGTSWPALTIYRVVATPTSCKCPPWAFPSRTPMLMLTVSYTTTIFPAAAGATSPTAATTNSATHGFPSSSNSVHTHNSHDWIAGAVVGPVIAIAAIATLLFVIFYMKKKHQDFRNRMGQQLSTNPIDQNREATTFHATSIHEINGISSPYRLVELNSQ